MSKAKVLTNLKRAESQRRTFRKLKYLRAKLHAGSVTFVTQVRSDGVHRDVTDKAGIEKVLLHTHENKYRQCEQTPMMQTPLINEFGIIGANTKAAQQVMLGQYSVPPGTDENVASVLKKLKCPRSH